MQSFDAKCEAITTLLPLLEVHLALVPGALKPTRYGQADEKEREAVAPPPPWTVIDCDGVCEHCDWQRDCKGDSWEVLAWQLRHRYRISAIAAALAHLDVRAHQLAHAVRAVYVEDYDRASEPVSAHDRGERRRWADAGVRYIARRIQGDVTGLYDRKVPLSEQITELRGKGFSYRAIQRLLGVSSKTIANLSAPKENAASV